jgi:hypothetical protein
MRPHRILSNSHKGREALGDNMQGGQDAVTPTLDPRH